jgi:asparagine synthase (glutamine-hydrolysing)
VTPRAEPFWKLREAAENGQKELFSGGDADAIDELELRLRDSIAGQMVADVPLGAFLSGGIDSSTVVALMQAQSGRPIKTFSIGFHEAGYDEAKHAKRIAKHIGTDHTELYVTAGEALAVVPRLPAMYDEPFADSSQIPTFLVASLARRRVTVSLSGDGGDELFGGYSRYPLTQKIWRRFGWMPSVARRSFAGALRRIRPVTLEAAFGWVGRTSDCPVWFGKVGDRIHKLANILEAKNSEETYLRLVSHWSDPKQLVIEADEPLTILNDPGERPNMPELLHRLMYLDLMTYLPEDILVKVDRASMAVSLESRIPLLDHRLVEFAWRLPIRMKVRDGQGKWLLKQVLFKYVPPQLVERPKMGFGIPLDEWLRGPLRDWSEALLDPIRLKQEGYLDVALVSKTWSEHLSRKRNWQYHLWDVLMFESWLAHDGSSEKPCH